MNGDDALDPDFLAFVDEYKASGGTNYNPREFHFPAFIFFDFAHHLASTGTADARDVELLMKAATGCRQYEYNFFLPLLRSESAGRVLDHLNDLEPALRPDPVIIARVIFNNCLRGTGLSEGFHPEAPFEEDLVNQVWNGLGEEELIRAGDKGLPPPEFHAALARYHPDALATLLKHRVAHGPGTLHEENWIAITRESEQFDDACLDAVTSALRVPLSSPHTSEANQARSLFKVLVELNRQRNDRHLSALLDTASRREFASLPAAVELLLEHKPDEVATLVAAGLGWDCPYSRTTIYTRLFADTLPRIGGSAELLFQVAIRSGGRVRQARLEALLTDPPPDTHDPIRRLLLLQASERSGKQLAEFWDEIAAFPAPLFLPEFREFLTGKSKPLRAAAATHLGASPQVDALRLATDLLASKKIDDRVGAVVLLGRVSSPDALKTLEAGLSTEKSKQVRRLMREVLTRLGVEVAPEPEAPREATPLPASVAEFETAIARRPKSIKLPRADWLDASRLPPLFTTDGTQLSDLAVTFVIQKQARGNGIAVAPEIAPLLPFLDRQRNLPFAQAVLDQWFASDQKANTQWALGLIGLTGDNTLIPKLTGPMEQWCEANRTALAQWAVKGISLLGTDEALATLDGLVQKYRSRRKYIGAAAREAIVTTAEMRGLSIDDLEDLIVPSFGFDADGRRSFTTRNGTIDAVLQPDFKLGWHQPETGKETRSTPSTLTEESKFQLKELRKFLRETVKAQTSRLERLMVQQHRWPVQRWRELFEQHPLLLTFAARLVWGVYDPDHRLLRCFRRYPNGLLAQADGELEELPEGDSRIGLVHPLELEQDDIAAWLAHLRRFKVKAPFPQLDRPVARLEPTHANRRQLTAAEGTTIDASTLRSRAEKRGWSLGTTGDGGSILSLFKQFPAVGIEVYLNLEGLMAFSGYGDEAILHEALFARFDTGRTRSYLPDEPDHSGNERVLSFGEVPAVVYSETSCDLAAFAAS